MLALPNKPGMNRFLWDLRYGAAPGEEGSGPLVAPGVYKAQLTAGGVTKTEPFTIKIDPRYAAKDGVTVANLQEQTKFLLKVQATLAQANQLAARAA